MYQVFRKGRKQFGKGFSTFEKARQEVRKYIRRVIEKRSYQERHDILGLWDSVSRSPSSYTILGFSIRRVS